MSSQGMYKTRSGAFRQSHAYKSWHLIPRKHLHDGQQPCRIRAESAERWARLTCAAILLVPSSNLSTLAPRPCDSPTNSRAQNGTAAICVILFSSMLSLHLLANSRMPSLYLLSAFAQTPRQGSLTYQLIAPIPFFQFSCLSPGDAVDDRQ